MNRNLLLGFVVVLALLLGVPFLSALKRNAAPPPAPAPAAAPAAPAAAEEETPPAEPEPAIEYNEEAPPPPVPQNLTAQDLVGSAWEVNTQYGMIQVQLNGGGSAVASHPMAGTLSGNWRITGNQVVVKASFMNQTQTIRAQVCGTTLCVNGVPLRRLR